MFKKLIDKLNMSHNTYMVEISHYGIRGNVLLYIRIKDESLLWEATHKAHKEWWKLIPESVVEPAPVISAITYYKLPMREFLKVRSYGKKVKMLADAEPFVWYC